MIPANFDEANGQLGPPEGMSEDECHTLRVWRGPREGDGAPMVISCWKPTQEELKEIQRTGRVWLWIMGNTMPPAFISGSHPWK
jgi:hypothetical protein